MQEQRSLLDAIKYTVDRFIPIAQAAKDMEMRLGLDGVVIGQKHPRKLDPFVYSITVPFGEARAGSEIEIRYQYCLGKQGYIIYQKVTNEGESTISDIHNNKRVRGYATSFHQAHAATEGIKISDLVSQDRKLSQAKNSIRLDARTKLLGEGARWNCVRDNMDKITDFSKLYTIKGNEVFWIIFADLWKTWASNFDSMFGISDETVKDSLLNKKVWGQDHEGREIRPDKKNKGRAGLDNARDIEIK